MVTMILSTPDCKATSRRCAGEAVNADLEQRAYTVLAQHSHFRGRVENFQLLQQDDVLVVRGSVPSFYLKQVLQTVLKDVGGIRSIDNRVDVVAAHGLSSVRYE